MMFQWPAVSTGAFCMATCSYAATFAKLTVLCARMIRFFELNFIVRSTVI